MGAVDDVIEYLRSKGLQVHKAAGQEVTVHCPFCPDGDPKGKGKLYVNTETCMFDCKRCGNHGGPKMLAELFGDEIDTSTFVPGTSPAARRAVFEEYTDLAHKALLGNEAMMLWLLRRGLDGDTIAEAKIGYHPRGVSLLKSLPGEHALADLKASGLLTEAGQDFHRGKIIIPYLTGGTVVQVRGKDPAGKYYTPPGDNVRLYGQDELRAADIVVVVEGEFDRLILRQTLMTAADPRTRRIRVVGLPGAGSWPGGQEGFPDYFREAKRVYLGLDPDDVGKREGLKLKEALGSKARILELPEDFLVDSKGAVVKCDWTEYLREKGPDHPYGGHGLKDVVHLIDHAEMTGKRIYSTREAVTLWERDQIDKPGMALGFPTLDAIIAPGLTPGSLTIPLAKTGTGKTVFLANVLYNLRDRRMLMISMEQTAVEVIEILMRIHRFHHPLDEPASLAEVMPWLAILDENRLTSTDFAMLVEEYTDQFGERPEGTCVDYLGYYARGFRAATSYERTGMAVMQLKAEAKTHHLAVISPHQVSRKAEGGKSFESDAARDSGVIEETADYIVGLFRPGDAIDSGTTVGMATTKMISKILKSRRGGTGKIIQLRMSPASLRMVDAIETHACNQIEQELAAINRGEHYGHVLAGQREAARQAMQTRMHLVGA